MIEQINVLFSEATTDHTIETTSNTGLWAAFLSTVLLLGSLMVGETMRNENMMAEIKAHGLIPRQADRFGLSTVCDISQDVCERWVSGQASPSVMKVEISVMFSRKIVSPIDHKYWKKHEVTPNSSHH